MVAQVTEGGGEAAALVKSMLVDTENLRASKGLTFAGFALGELVVDALDSRRSQFGKLGQTGAADAVLMFAPDPLAEGLTGMPARQDAGQRLDEAAVAAKTLEASALNDEPGEGSKALEVSDLTPVSALTVQVVISAVRAGTGPFGGWFHNDSYRGLVLPGFDSVSSNSYLTKYWGHDGHSSSFGLMSPFFDEEPKSGARFDS